MSIWSLDVNVMSNRDLNIIQGSLEMNNQTRIAKLSCYKAHKTYDDK